MPTSADPTVMPHAATEAEEELVIVIEDSDEEYSGGQASETDGYDAGSDVSDAGGEGARALLGWPRAAAADSTTPGDLNEFLRNHIAEIQALVSPLSPSNSRLSSTAPWVGLPTATNNNLYRAGQFSCLPAAILEEIDVEPVPLDYSMNQTGRETHRESSASPEIENQHPPSSQPRELPQRGRYFFQENTSFQTTTIYHPPSRRQADPLVTGYGYICDCVTCFPPLPAAFPQPPVPHNSWAHLFVSPRQEYDSSPVIVLRHKVQYWYPTSYAGGRNGWVPNEYAYVGQQWFYSEFQGYYPVSNRVHHWAPNDQDYYFRGTRIEINIMYDRRGPYWVEDVALSPHPRCPRRAAAQTCAAGQARAPQHAESGRAAAQSTAAGPPAAQSGTAGRATSAPPNMPNSKSST